MKYLIAAGVLIFAASAAGPAAALGKAEDALARALACREIAPDADRLACLDQALAGVAVEARKAKKDETPELFGMVPEAPEAKDKKKQKDLPFIAQTPEEFGAENVPELRAEQEEKRLKSIAFTATKVTTNSRNMATIYLENGQVWRQLESDNVSFFPKKNRQYGVEIRRGALGNYLASIDGFSKPLRVERIK